MEQSASRICFPDPYTILSLFAWLFLTLSQYVFSSEYSLCCWPCRQWGIRLSSHLYSIYSLAEDLDTRPLWGKGQGSKHRPVLGEHRGLGHLTHLRSPGEASWGSWSNWEWGGVGPACWECFTQRRQLVKPQRWEAGRAARTLTRDGAEGVGQARSWGISHFILAANS